MFPIRNEIGDVIAFSGRQLRENKNSGKYINSPETCVFRKSERLFALDRAKKPILKEKAALLCEGQLDVISCHEAGHRPCARTARHGVHPRACEAAAALHQPRAGLL